MKLSQKYISNLPAIVRDLYRQPLSIGYPQRLTLSKLWRTTATTLPQGEELQVARPLLTAIAAAQEIGLGEAAINAILLCLPVQRGSYTLQQVTQTFGPEVATLVSNLIRVFELYGRDLAVTSNNFSHFLLSFAQDIRVILILIAERITAMRLADRVGTQPERMILAREVAFLYAPLAHRLGLYTLKGEMEDLCLKFSDRETFSFVKRKLNETKASRDAYIASFIAPLKKELERTGLNFEIKGRTKSISSIRNKLKKQNIEFEAIYDLFAIRIILDVPQAEERSKCWQVYSVVTDMYRPNPKRLKDWISIPKSNGYESLHITVMGPENKWVEVQIRTRRMDEIAERGVAAHWRYKGIKSESGLDEFMTNVRRVLEQQSSNNEELIKEFKMDLYEREIYVFTPKGDLIKLPQGATVLDFAFAIHSGLGERCVSGKVNDKNVSIRHVLRNGDSVSVLTANTQQPKPDWLQFVVTAKARGKIKQHLREQQTKALDYAKEELQRKLKNRKIEYDDATFTRLIKRKGYKTVTDFFRAVSAEVIDLNTFLDEYKTAQEHTTTTEHPERESADAFVAQTTAEQIAQSNDVLLIDKNLSGIEYKLAKCCNPIYGDKVFAFVSNNGIRIHRHDCPNAPDLYARYGYRILQAEWTSKNSGGYEVTVKIIGNDDISVVNNISSQIDKEADVSLRSFNIESHDGLFIGYFTIYVKGVSPLNMLLKKLRGAKGVKSVERLDASR